MLEQIKQAWSKLQDHRATVTGPRRGPAPPVQGPPLVSLVSSPGPLQWSETFTLKKGRGALWHHKDPARSEAQGRSRATLALMRRPETTLAEVSGSRVRPEDAAHREKEAPCPAQKKGAGRPPSQRPGALSLSQEPRPGWKNPAPHRNRRAPRSRGGSGTAPLAWPAASPRDNLVPGARPGCRGGRASRGLVLGAGVLVPEGRGQRVQFSFPVPFSSS